MDRDSQIRAIEKTFEDNKKPIEKHYSKPNVYPVEISPIFPDFKVFFKIFTIDYLIVITIFFFIINSCGSIHVHKLFLTLILHLWEFLYPLKSRRCHRQ